MLDGMHFSSYGRRSALPSPVARMMAAFAGDFRDGVDVNLGVGYVNEATIPRAAIRRAFDAVIGDPARFRLSLNYGGPDGAPDLVRAIRRFYLRRCIGGLTSRHLDRCGIAVGASGATSIMEGIAQLLKPGIVITSDPQYYIYTDFLRRQGFRVVSVPEDGEGISAAGVRDALRRLGSRRSAVSFFYVVTVNNPTCTVLSNARRRELVRIAARLSRDLGRPVPVFFDKAYEYLVHDPGVGPLESGLVRDRAGIVYEIDTLSKILAPALRIGFLMGRDGPFMRAMVQKISDTGFSAPLLNQEAAAVLLQEDVDRQMRKVQSAYRRKARETLTWIRRFLGEDLEDLRGGRAGFYYFLTFRSVETHEQSPFFRFLSRTTGDPSIDGNGSARNPRVVYLPGQFCVDPGGSLAATGRRQLRISYGFEELPRIREALDLMGEAAAWAKDHLRGGRRRLGAPRLS